MYCGSCMHDNTLVRALIETGMDVQLIPAYTPIRTDEKNISSDRVFFGGINVYLQQKIPFFRHLPGFLDRCLDMPWLIRMLTAKAVETSPAELGGLTVSMLKGTSGFQRKEVLRLCKWLTDHVQPDLLVLTNVLIAGCVPELKRELGIPVIATLQGDDIFLESLPQPYKDRAIAEITQLVGEIDGFICHSRFYAEFMKRYIGVPEEKLHVTPLGIDTSDFQHLLARDSSPTEPIHESQEPTSPMTIGYLARQAPEKGLHLLVDAFIELRKRESSKDVRLRIAGWIGSHNQKYIDEQTEKLLLAGLADDYENLGTIDRSGKLAFLESVDIVSVPTTYQEPKGLYALEAMGSGSPCRVTKPRSVPRITRGHPGWTFMSAREPDRLGRSTRKTGRPTQKLHWTTRTARTTSHSSKAQTSSHG